MNSNQWWSAGLVVFVLAGCPGTEEPIPQPNPGGTHNPGVDGGLVGGGGQTSDGGSTGTGNSAAATVSPEGGTVTVDGVTLTVPAGALSEPLEIRITSTTVPTPSGYQAYSPLYRFEPEGTIFAKPVSVAIPFTGDARLARLFWSRQGASGFTRVGGVASGGVVTSEITHFSEGFIANGVDYTEPPDLSCTRTKLLEGRTGQPVSSAVSVFFSVEDCHGRPVTGLMCAEYPAMCDFVLKENDTKLSTEAQATFLQKNGLHVFASLLLDVSISTKPQLPDLIDAAKAFVNELRVNKGVDVPISIQLFAGEPTLTEWQAPTLDMQQLLQRLDEVASYEPADPSSTNLYGGVITAIERIAAAEADFQQRNFGGAFTAGYVVLFTDGTDTAGLKTKAEAVAFVQGSRDELLVIALQSADYDAAAHQALVELAGADKVIVSQGASSLYGDFANLGARIAGQINRTYLLGYCSPKRSGMHALTLEIAHSTPLDTLTFAFDASAFQPGCAAEDFEIACIRRECGGLGCGGCDDRLASCNPVSQQCVSYCEQQAVCGGATITNPRGYVQTCNDTPENTQCGTSCTDLTFDESNCGACGNSCPTGAYCVDSSCGCPSGFTLCGGACTDTKTDAVNCGTCGTICAAGGTCQQGACTCPSGQMVCGSTCSDLLSDPQNCSACGTACGGTSTCNAGKCLWTIAGNQASPYDVAVDATHVYWTNSANHTVMKAPISGGAPVVLASAPSYPSEIAVDGSHVYWTASSSVMKVPVGGGSPQVLASGQSHPGALVIDATNVYWLTYNTVVKAPKGGGAAVTLASTTERAKQLAVDANNVYWTTDAPQGSTMGYINAVPIGGGPVQVLGSSSYPDHVAVDQTQVYWTGYSSANVPVLSVPVAGGPVMQLAYVQQQSSSGIAVDGTHVYWTSVYPGKHQVMRVPIGGGTAVSVASGQSYPQGIAADATSVYWANRDNGTIMRLAK